jgi:hypothetical protein
VGGQARAAELGARRRRRSVDESAPRPLRWRASTPSTSGLASNLRQFTGRPFLGHGVEYLLEESETTVVVVTLPPGWGGGARGR